MFIEDKKDKLIQLRVTSKQKDIIKKLASEEGLTITRYIFSLIDKEYKRKSK